MERGSVHDEKFHRMVTFYSEFIKPSDLAFDIGANHGNRTEVFLELGAHVVAAEPHPFLAKELRNRFGSRDEVQIVEKALGRHAGTAILAVSNNDTVSSMSPEWIEKVRTGGRFDDSRWERSIEVGTTTLDVLIALHGEPAFIKIDVEGFEDEVLAGLRVPVKALSFEYTPEHLEPALRSMARLLSLGEYSFNYSVGETMMLALDRYVGIEELIGELEEMLASSRPVESGDIYARRR
jgi:FkbM family methyltransferase